VHSTPAKSLSKQLRSDTEGIRISNMAWFKNLTPSLALFVRLVISAKGATVHGGHNIENIVDGEAVSVDPIVSNV
jgi:hypothetical protein